MIYEPIKRIVFVWDGTQEMIDQCHSLHHIMDDYDVVHAIHAMPHESIYTYSYRTPENARACTPPGIDSLKQDFAERTQRTPLLRSVELQILFGDRISEICAYSQRVKASLLIAPSFEQTSFSRWVHGDLDRRLQENASCMVLLVGQGMFVSGYSPAIEPPLTDDRLPDEA